jgi:hypothetical protein
VAITLLEGCAAAGLRATASLVLRTACGVLRLLRPDELLLDTTWAHDAAAMEQLLAGMGSSARASGGGDGGAGTAASGEQRSFAGVARRGAFSGFGVAAQQATDGRGEDARSPSQEWCTPRAGSLDEGPGSRGGAGGGGPSSRGSPGGSAATAGSPAAALAAAQAAKPRAAAAAALQPLSWRSGARHVSRRLAVGLRGVESRLMWRCGRAELEPEFQRYMAARSSLSARYAGVCVRARVSGRLRSGA